LGPRVAGTAAARGALLAAIAWVALLGARSPTEPGPIALVRDTGGCRLGFAEGPPCDCRELPADARAALGLPQPLNRASAVALERVPGLGPARARAIALERAHGGAFDSLEALSRRVPGIGPRTVDRIRPHLFAVGPDPACGVGGPSRVGPVAPTASKEGGSRGLPARAP
jgi:competence protein ComEA